MTDVSEPGARLSPDQIKMLLQKRRERMVPANDGIPRLARTSPRFPLSFSQQRLWFLCQLTPDSTAYNNPVTARLQVSANRSLDPQLLGAAINELIARHEILRTTFELVDGEPMQVVAPSLDVPVNYLDLQSTPATMREADAIARLRDEAQLPFDLARGPLLRVTILRLGSDDYMLLINMHHLISDAWSVGVFLREMLTIAMARKAGFVPPLAPLSIQYADFCVWQRERLRGAAYERLATYWRGKLAAPLPVLELPLARSRKYTQQPGVSHVVQLPAGLTRQINVFAKQSNTTPFVVLLATFKLLLRRYVRSSDIVVGTPVANRTHRDIEGLIGCFINTLVLRTNLSDVASFHDGVSRVKQTSLDALSHQDLPFELLVNELQPQRSLDVNPLFQTMFSMQNAPIETTGIGASVKVVDLGGVSTKFDLSLTAMELNDTLSLNWTYRADRYEASAIERMAQQYRVLLEAALTNPGESTEALPILPASELAQIQTLQTSRGAASNQHTYAEWFDQAAESCPETVALRQDDEQVTYAQLRRSANGLAHRLVARGVRCGDVVALLFDRSPAMIAALIAVMKAGAAYLPIDPAWPAQRIAAVIARAGARLTLTPPAYAPLMPGDGSHLVIDPAESFDAQVEQAPEVGAAPDDLAYVIFTSGTSGEPKGIGVEQRHLVRYVENISAQMQLPRGSSHAIVSTLSADLAHTMLFPCLVNAGTLLLATETQARDPEALARWLDLHPADALKIVPSHLDALSDIANFERLLPKQLLVVGGEALSASLVRKLANSDTAFRLLNHYGPTETTVGVIAGEIALDPDMTGGNAPLGRPLGDARIYICDDSLNRMPLGVAGELCIGGGTVARGYIGRADLTAERFHSDPFAHEANARLYRSGDLARLNEDGTVEFLGRIDDQVKIRGHRVEPAEVEAVVRAWPNARDAVVKAVTLQGQTALAAWVVAVDAPDEAALRAYLKTRLVDAMIPARFVFLSELSRTLNGKVNRQALQLEEHDQAPASAPFLAPRTRLELAIVQLWGRLLARDDIGIHDNFFDLGGHSLLAVRLVAAVQKEFGIAIPLVALFENATVEKFAHLLDGTLPASASGALVPIQPKGDRTPLFFVHPAGGNVLCYFELARELGEDQPFLGLQAIDDASEDAVANACAIESMARTYVAAMRSKQPLGPYQLGGWSMGGVVAFEMAQQLRSAGQDVSLLAILDIPAPGGVTRGDRDRIDDAAALAIYAQKIEVFSGRSLGMDRADVANLSVDALSEHLLTSMREANIVPEEVAPAQLRRFMQIQKAHNYASLNYAPQIYVGNLTVIRCSAPPPIRQEAELLRLDALYAEEALGWAKFSAQEPVIRFVPGNHVEMMSQPYVRDVATALRSCLR